MKKSKLILSFYVGVIAVGVATLSMSVAWYASADRVVLDGIEMTIDSDRDLFISTSRDGEYVESLDKSDLNQISTFFPVTSAYSSTWMATKSDKPVFYDETGYSPIETSVSKTATTRGFFCQKLYLLADDDLYVSIKADETYIRANETYNEIEAEALYETYQKGQDESLKALSKDDIKARLNKLVNAMRFSILITDENEYEYVVIDPNKNDETYFGGLLDNNKNQYYDHFVSDTDALNYERVYGEILNKDKIIYDDALTTDSGFENENEEPNAFNARHKNGVKRFNLEKSLANGVEIKKENALDLKDFEGKNKPFTFNVYRDEPKEIVLSIYIEGWDLDSVNYTMGATFISNLTFMIEREM